MMGKPFGDGVQAAEGQEAVGREAGPQGLRDSGDPSGSAREAYEVDVLRRDACPSQCFVQ